MASEIIGPVILVATVTVAGTGGMAWAALSTSIAPPASALVHVEDRVRDVDGDGAVDGHTVTVDRASRSLEGVQVEMIAGQASVTVRAVEDAGVYVPCGVADHVQAVVWVSKVNNVYSRETARTLDLDGCPGPTTQDDGESGQDDETGAYTDPDQGCGWITEGVDAIKCLTADTFK